MEFPRDKDAWSIGHSAWSYFLDLNLSINLILSNYLKSFVESIIKKMIVVIASEVLNRNGSG
jgi:hypothetical protein